MNSATTRSRFGLVAVLILVGCGNEGQQSVELYRAPAISNTVDGVVFEAGNWEPHLAAGEEGSSWGNHRAVVVVADPSVEAVTVTIPWRRRDADPFAKSVVVLDASTGEPVPNALATRIENASGDVIFQPNPGSSTYHVYYMPWHSTGSYYPTITYPDMAPEAEAAWADAVQVAGGLPNARTTHIQSVDDFHSFFPMEVIATPEETAAFMDGSSPSWKLATEHRDFPVRMRHFIPWQWTTRADMDVLRSRALRDEAFTFQVVVIAAEEGLTDLEVSFEGFPEKWREALTCFNCGGINEKGEPFENEIAVPAATIQPLWIGVQIPENQPAGTVEGMVRVTTANASSRSVRVELEVLEARANNGGDNEPDLMTRLAWLDSTVGTDPDFIIAPFESVTVDGRSISILGRKVELSATGLPDQILSFFTPELGLGDEAQPILARSIDLDVVVAEQSGSSETDTFQSAAFEIEQSSRGRAQWTVESTSERFSMTVEGGLEYDGMLDYRISLTALADVDVEDIALPIHYEPSAATFMLGLGRMGGRRPPTLDWTWAFENHHEGLWLGGINEGLQYVLRDDNYARPLNTNFYRNQPLRMPPSWFNEGRGGIRIREEEDAVVAHNYSGPRSISAGDTLHFNVRFLITPFKPIDTEKHFETRFVHQYEPVDQVKAWGGTVVNIHHANEINPYINYPFFNLDRQAAYIDEAHELGIKFKLYYTIRELTYKAHEMFALRSLGDEILNDGDGGGHSWLQEHLEDHYHSAWHAFRVDDAAILNKGTSRWTNYYIAGLAWLAENQHIDGLYLDDIAFSRETVKRLVTVLHEHRDEVIIDLHSANQFNERDGFINSAMLYMEHFPYISRLWFGEYFDYDQGPDYWMTEVAGLPFGLMGEMLQDGGHPYRGMLYGMTARKYGDVDPRPVWGMMNDFGIAESRMLGYWLEDAPVQTGNPQVLATTYARPDGVLIALASWSETDEVIDLKVDFEAIGLENEVRAYAPSVGGLQEATEVDLSAVEVPAEMGVFLLLGDVS